MKALSLFTTRPEEGLVVASTVGNRWIDTVGCMVSTVLYRWQPHMSYAEWKDHMLEVQAASEASILDVNLPTHSESCLPLTPFLVVWEDQRWWGEVEFDDFQRPWTLVTLTESGLRFESQWRDDAVEELWVHVTATDTETTTAVDATATL
jgi:hypothetical protein